MKIIAIGHYRRVGKDTFANCVIEKVRQLNPRIRVGKRSWAWKLKQICHELYAWAGLREPEYYETEPGASLREVPLPEIGKSPRQIWIDFGTPAVRESACTADTWLDYLLKKRAPAGRDADPRHPVPQRGRGGSGSRRRTYQDRPAGIRAWPEQA